MIRIVRRLSLAAIRPLPIIVEGYISDRYELVQAIPIAMLLMTLSSLPLHREVFLNSFSCPVKNRQYLSNVGIIQILFYLLSISMLTFTNDILFGILVGSVFLFEKIFDEYLRMLNYRKELIRWEVFQLIRVVIPVAAVLIYSNSELYIYYLVLFYLIGFFVCLVFFYLKISMIGLSKIAIKHPISTILDALPYQVGVLNPLLAINLPRVFITQSFSEWAHLYMALSQLSGIIPVVYNIKFQVPYRRLMSLKPILYAKALARVNLLLMLITATVLTIAVSLLVIGLEMLYLKYLILFLACISISICHAVSSNYLGLMVWFLEKKSFLIVNLKFLLHNLFFIFLGLFVFRFLYADLDYALLVILLLMNTLALFSLSIFSKKISGV